MFITHPFEIFISFISYFHSRMKRKTSFPFAFRSFIRNFATIIDLIMTISEFFNKFRSWYLWGNILAMLLTVAVLCAGVKFGIDLYTHHGEKIHVPNIRHKSFADAEHILDGLGLEISISDTGYVKTLPPDCILEQSIVPGTIVKSGRVVYVVINAAHTPTLSIPDVIDNSSYREARAKLIAMGFKVGDPQYVPGEKDWVYGIKCKGRLVTTGQKVPIDALLIIQVGDGLRDMNDSVAYTYKKYDEFEEEEEEPLAEPEVGDIQQTEETDEFEEVKEPE